MKPKGKKSTITNKKNPKQQASITSKISGLNSLNKKPEDTASVSSTARMFLKDSNRTTLKQDSMNPGVTSPKDLISTRQLNEIKFKVMARQAQFTVSFTEEIREMQVSEFKNKFLEEYLEDGIYGARLIWSGRELRNSHQMKEFDLENNPMVYVFLFNIQDREFETRKITTLKTDPNLGVDFDYFVERNALSEEEVAWKRFCYHAPYIFRAKMSKISDYYLFMREIDFMNSNKDLKKEKTKFRGMKLKEVPEFDRNITKTRKYILFIVLFLSGLFLGPLALPLIKLSLSQKMRFTIVIGGLFYTFLLIFWKVLFGVGIMSPIQILLHNSHQDIK